MDEGRVFDQLSLLGRWLAGHLGPVPLHGLILSSATFRFEDSISPHRHRDDSRVTACHFNAEVWRLPSLRDLGASDSQSARRSRATRDAMPGYESTRPDRSNTSVAA
jgi:hypothetical protein